ncbi:MAG: hypothetical protein K5770_01965 [Lachnospiraceae bacterium]|nr:hypothetical protein [Lachnospiraceae bacterium]
MREQIRRTVALLMVFCLSLNLTACGGDDAGDAAKKAKETAENAAKTVQENVKTVQETAENAAKTMQETTKDVQESAQNAARTAMDTADSVKDTALSVKDTVVDWYKKIDLQKFKDGWDRSVDFLGSGYSAVTDGKYIDEVAETIDSLKAEMESAAAFATDLKKEAQEAAKEWSGHFDITDYTGPPSLQAQAEARDIIRAYNEYVLKEKSTLSLKDFLDEEGETLKTDALYDSLYGKTDDRPETGEDVPLSEIIGAKYVLNQAMGTDANGQKKLLSTVVSMGPDVFSIIKEAALNSGMDEDELEEAGIEQAIAESGGFVEGSVSRMLVSLCKSGALGEEMVDVGAPVIGALTVLTIKGAINGYSLAKGDITPEDYGNLMADDAMITLMSIPNPALILAVLPASKIVLLTGCMAGGIVAGAGYLLAKDAVLNLVDGGGFEAIIPAASGDKRGIAKDLIASLGITDALSGLKDTIVSTTKNGMITVSASE